jgi:hypothetical protein
VATTLEQLQWKHKSCAGASARHVGKRTSLTGETRVFTYAFYVYVILEPPYFKTWSKVSLGLKLMLSLLFAKGVTVTAF